DRLIVLGAELVQLVGVHDDILALAVFVTGDDLIVGDFPVNRAGLLVVDSTMALGMELVEADVASAAYGRGISLDRNRDETQLQKPFPTGAWRHRATRNGDTVHPCAWPRAILMTAKIRRVQQLERRFGCFRGEPLS